MRITYKGDYALKTILDLAQHYGEKPITISDLASRADIPIKFLEQILLDLKRGGFVQSRRGKVGGYMLNRHPSKLTLGEVVRFVDGPIEPVACVNKGYKGCNEIGRCVFRGIWSEVARTTSKLIDGLTFEELVKRSKASRVRQDYQI
jgi:Rrf2 family transcriptional regulator, cysteine metabolism repressor